jgi:hypothetical protein
MSARAQAAVSAPQVSSAADVNLDLVRTKAPVVDRVLAGFGHLPIEAYLREAFPTAGNCFQPRDDLLTVVENYAAPLLGDEVAASLRAGLAEFPLVLTANHHGIDYFSQSVQGSLIFSLLGTVRGMPHHYGLVLACGGVPLDNFTYPMGFLLYAGRRANWETLPVRMPVFSNRYRRELVSAAGSMDAPLIERARQRCAALASQGDICASLGPTLDSILRDYADPDVLQLAGYSQQSVVLNHRLWQRLFSEPARAPQVATLELERITRELLAADLRNAGSLAWCVHFDAQLRRLVWNALDGARACWDSELLLARLRALGSGTASANTAGSGTFLYWGVTDRGRRVPLYLDEQQANPRLRGVDDAGNAIEFPFSPEGLMETLARGRLLPSLFNCFLTISFARGVNCAGAYYQAEYLPEMRDGVVSALEAATGYERAAQCVAGVPAETYLAGMQTVMRRHDDGALVPAGLVEIIAAGGLTSGDVEKILSLPVRDAHIASLMETVADLAPQEAKSADWRRRIGEDCNRLLADSVIIK